MEDHIAADFIASEFMRLGLEPVGDAGTYFQKMEIDTARWIGTTPLSPRKSPGAEHAYRLADFRWARQSLHPATACGAIVFAGYGISAPEYGYNDFAGIDVKGKVVLVLAASRKRTIRIRNSWAPGTPTTPSTGKSWRRFASAARRDCCWCRIACRAS